MKGTFFIETKQKSWALRKSLKPVAPYTDGSDNENGAKNYLTALSDNLFEPLSKDAEACFRQGDGNEIDDSNSRLAKMKALHSSSALAVNAFHYWNGRDVYPIMRACGLIPKNPKGVDLMIENIGSDNPVTRSISKDGEASQIVFEEKFPISDDLSTFPRPPHLDVVINFQSKLYAVESKFSEPYGGKPGGLKPAYVDRPELWKGLSNLYSLAKTISSDNNKFRHLDAAQLMKHILGLTRNRTKSQFQLLYLWYDVYGSEGEAHRQEIEAFGEVVKKDGVSFSHTTYQEVITHLAREFYGGNEKYIDYLTDRYL